MSMIWHNGEFKNDAPIFTAHDRLRLGDGVFDTMLAINGKPYFADLHFERLLMHAEILGIKANFSGDFESIAKDLLKQNNFSVGRHAINTIISHGPSKMGLMAPEKPDIQIVMRALPTAETFPDIRAIIAKTTRRNEGSPLSRIKSCNYGDSLLAMTEAKENNANEAILLNNRGFVACASSSNVFAIINGILVTPPLQDGAMDGITRRILMEKLDVKEQGLRADDLLKADAIYLTSSIRGVAPVISLNGKLFPPASLQIDKDVHLF